jgi:hypothetical protein
MAYSTATGHGCIVQNHGESTLVACDRLYGERLEATDVAEGFYVSVLDRKHLGGPLPKGARFGFLLGPYSTRADAEYDLPQGKRLARQVSDDAHRYACGVARVVVSAGKRLPRGLLNDLVARTAAHVEE